MTAPTELEKTKLTLGFVALLDCAPLVVAREKGFFNKYGLSVVLSKESSWATIRDKVSFGILDGAQMLAPMPLAATLGLNGNKTPMVTALALSQNGTAITLGKDLFLALSQHVTDWDNDETVGSQFKALIKSMGRKPVIATVYPYSNHHYQLRYWLKKHNISFSEDVELVAIPPTKMLENLSNGLIDGYCVGEPWNSLALINQSGGLLTTGYRIWGTQIEKVLGVTAQWADENPLTHQALVRAIYEACEWISQSENKDELIELLSLPPYLDRSANLIKGFTPPYSMEQRFYGNEVNLPGQQQGQFLLEQMQACGQLADEQIDLFSISKQVFREDLYREWCTN